MNESKTERIAERIAADIASGRRAPGSPLPTHRQLAAQYDIAIATATRVYERLKASGLIVGEVGRGTFVRDRAAQREWDVADEARLNSATVDLSFNHPTLPGQTEQLRTLLRDIAATGDLGALLHQQPPGGRLHERDIASRFLDRHRQISVPARQLFLVNGAQQGLDMVVRTLLRPGEAVAVDALTYPGFKMLAAIHGLALKPVKALANGPDLAALEAHCRRGGVRAIYVMPTLHNPLGWVLARKQRQQIVAIARRYDCHLIEDAAYAHLVDDAPPPLFALAPERTFHVSSLSKSVATGLRFGFLIAPQDFETRIKATIRASYWSLPGIVTAMATRWLGDGTVARLEAAHRRDARRRQAIARTVFRGMDVVAHPSALFLWLRLPPELRADRIVAALAAQRIAVSKAEAYATTRQVPRALRVGLSSVPIEQLKDVLSTVRATIERFPP